MKCTECIAYHREQPEICAACRRMQEKRSSMVEIDCVEFMQLMKMVCYMKQIRRIVEDD